MSELHLIEADPLTIRELALAEALEDVWDMAQDALEQGREDSTCNVVIALNTLNAIAEHAALALEDLPIAQAPADEENVAA